VSALLPEDADLTRVAEWRAIGSAQVEEHASESRRNEREGKGGRRRT
jgi:hypothetical protein